MRGHPRQMPVVNVVTLAAAGVEVYTQRTDYPHTTWGSSSILDLRTGRPGHNGGNKDTLSGAWKS